MKVFLIIVISLLHFGLVAQDSTAIVNQDSVNDAKILNEFYNKTKFRVSLTNQRTLLTSGVDIKINAFNVGVQFKRHYKVGLYALWSKKYQLGHLDIPEVSYYEGVILGYGAYFEYVILENYRYYVGVPFTVSNAWVDALAMNEGGDRLKDYDLKSDNFRMISLGVSAGYSINYWLTLSTGIGYRASFSDYDYENNLLSTPFYILGVKVKFGNFITTISHRKKVLKMKSIYFREKVSWRGNKFKKRHPNL